MDNSTSCRILCLSASVTFALVGAFTTGAKEEHGPPTSISEIKLHPMQYDGKVVRVTGWLSSGHLGIALYEDGHCSAVHVRPPDEVRLPAAVRVHRDQFFDQFWSAAENELLPYKGPRVEIDALVRILKKDGKPAKRFYVFGQFPIELIPIRVAVMVPSNIPSVEKAPAPAPNPCTVVPPSGAAGGHPPPVR